MKQSQSKTETILTVPPLKRTYLKQADVPAAPLEEALRVPCAIYDHYAGKPTLPLYVAKALDLDPRGSQFRVLSGAAIAFGLIEGGAQAASISVTELARRIFRPKQQGMDIAAKRESLLKPRIFCEFLCNYDGHPFPRRDIAINVLEESGIPRDKAEEVLSRIEASAQSVGFMEEIKGRVYVSLRGATGGNANDERSEAADGGQGAETSAIEDPNLLLNTSDVTNPFVLSASASTKEHHSIPRASVVEEERRRRVFITHGKSRDLIEPIKKLLEYGELVPVISVERQSVSKPVPEKVMDDMRGCGAAIIHVDADESIVDKGDLEHIIINSNVLIEIGAAMAFFRRRFILLVREGVKLPSNLQGLYEVRYSGVTLDAVSTIKLLEAINDIKNYALPIS